MKTKKKSFDYTVLDVFTETKFSGNQLAVINIDRDLDDLEYENISREFDYSESSFVYYSTKDKTLKIRSFTSTGFEIHGAGHNLLGVVSNSLIKNEEIFEGQNGSPFVIMKEDKIHVEIDQSSVLPVIGMKQRPASLKNVVPKQQLANGLSISTKEFWDKLQPAVVATEVSHLMVPLKDINTLDKVSQNKKILSKLGEEYGFEGVYCFSLTNEGSKYITEARFFNPSIGIDEDPATGSAAGPLVGFLYNNGFLKPDVEYQFLQGKMMKRPSVIRVKVMDDGILVSGTSVITMEGKIYL